jgi:hypothetical protein
MIDDNGSKIVSFIEARKRKSETNQREFNDHYSKNLHALQAFLVAKLGIEEYDPAVFRQIVVLIDERNEVLGCQAGMYGLLPIAWRIVDKCAELAESTELYPMFDTIAPAFKERNHAELYNEINAELAKRSAKVIAPKVREQREEVFRILGNRYQTPEFIKPELHELVGELMKYSPHYFRKYLGDWAVTYVLLLSAFVTACSEKSLARMTLKVSEWQENF